MNWIDRSARALTSPRGKLPGDIKRCHALIKDLRAELRSTRTENVKLQADVEKSRDAATEIGHLEELIARQQETISEQEQTIENLAADNALLKRSLFGSRRERFTGDPDPAQTLLFDATSLDSPSSEDASEPATPDKKKRTIG